LSKASKANFAIVDMSPRDLASSTIEALASEGRNFLLMLMMVEITSMMITAPTPHLIKGNVSTSAPP